MHPNQAFRDTETATAHGFARARGFGILTAAGPEGPLASHVPFLLHADRAEAHLVRSTALARMLRSGPLEALLIVSGPDGYISPDWYGQPEKVPTWNYQAVHLRGRLSLAEESGLRAHLERLSAHFEAMLAPKPAWTLDKMDPEALAKMLRMILPVRFEIAAIESTYKLNQNREEDARRGAIAALEAGDTPGLETRALAGLMRAALED